MEGWSVLAVRALRIPTVQTAIIIGHIAMARQIIAVHTTARTMAQRTMDQIVGQTNIMAVKRQ